MTRLIEMRWPEIVAYLEQHDTILLPVGAIEQHGPHLPVGTDTLQAVELCERAALRAGVLIAPPISYGWSPHHMAFAGTITLGASTLEATVSDVCRSLVWHGFQRILIVNGHRVANLPPLQIAAAKVNAESGALVAVYDLALSGRSVVEAVTSATEGSIGHACEEETARMLALHPEQVAIERAHPAPVTPTRFQSGGFAVTDPTAAGTPIVYLPRGAAEFRDAHPSGVAGDPTRATSDEGERLIRGHVDDIIDVIGYLQGLHVEIAPRSFPI